MLVPEEVNTSTIAHLGLTLEGAILHYCGMDPEQAPMDKQVFHESGVMKFGRGGISTATKQTPFANGPHGGESQ